MTTRVCGRTSAIRRSASTPSHPGHDDVHHDHVRRQALGRREVRRRRPPPRRPPRSPPCCVESSAHRPCRTTGWSSTRSTRIAGVTRPPRSVAGAARPGRAAKRSSRRWAVSAHRARPSSRAARSAIDVSPRWRPRGPLASGSKPMPSSATSSSITSSWSDRRTSTVAAPAWRTALASASCAIRSTWRLAPARRTGSGGGV